MSEHDEAVERVRRWLERARLYGMADAMEGETHLRALLAAYDALSEQHEAVCRHVDAELARVVEGQFAPVLEERASLRQEVQGTLRLLAEAQGERDALRARVERLRAVARAGAVLNGPGPAWDDELALAIGALHPGDLSDG